MITRYYRSIPIGDSTSTHKVVLASDFDAALARHVADLKLRDRELEIAAEHHSELQEQLAALREELADKLEELSAVLGRESLTEQRLTAAEQRNADMLNWLRRQANADKGSVAGYAFTEAHNALKKIAEAKPTESGASE